MACSLLSEIHNGSTQWTICVLVSRLWHYRGGTDDGDIKHTDLVLLDIEGNHMYGQIPAGIADRLKDVLEEGKVYVIKKFLCNPSKPHYRPVESPFMVQFTRYTVVQEKPGLEDTFPFCTYSLTAFPDIPRPTTNPPRFVDVIGRITMVSDVIPVQSMYQTTASNTRTIMLTYLLGTELRLVLWGDRAVEFDAEAVHAMGAKESVIAIFVGTLPKTARGIRGLSGSAACRWYVDEDVPDINSFRASLGEQFTPLATYVPTGPDALLPRVQETPVDKTVKELTELDPFVDMNKRFFCTVTVGSVGAEQRWWFPSCATCRKSAKHNGYQYRCSDNGCSSVEADLTYCVSVFASDGTAEAEFVLFDKVAAGAIGKPLIALLRKRHPGYVTVDEIASIARHDKAIPPEITRLIGQKYKLLVCISKKWQTQASENLSFQINRIEETYKPELPSPVLVVASGSAEPSSSGGGSGAQFPILGPLIAPTASTPPALGSTPGQAFRSPHGSPAGQTPASSATKLSPSTPAARSSAHKRGARCSLFRTPLKGKQPDVAGSDAPSAQVADLVEPAVEIADADAPSAQVTDLADPAIQVAVNAAAANVEEKEPEIVASKTKRTDPQVKTSGGKKQRK